MSGPTATGAVEGEKPAEGELVNVFESVMASLGSHGGVVYWGVILVTRGERGSSRAACLIAPPLGL